MTQEITVSALADEKNVSVRQRHFLRIWGKRTLQFLFTSKGVFPYTIGPALILSITAGIHFHMSGSLPGDAFMLILVTFPTGLFLLGGTLVAVDLRREFQLAVETNQTVAYLNKISSFHKSTLEDLALLKQRLNNPPQATLEVDGSADMLPSPHHGLDR